MKYIIEQSSNEQLQQILSERNKYKESFIVKVEEEVEIRKGLDKFNDRVTKLSDDELSQLLNDQNINLSYLRACQLENIKREAKREEERKQEAARQKAEQEQRQKEEQLRKEAKRQARINTAKKYKYPIAASVVAVILFGFYLYFTSSGVRFETGAKYFDEGMYDEAINSLSKVSKSSKYYSTAQLMLTDIYDETFDKKEAANALTQAATVAEKQYLDYGAVVRYADALLSGGYAPYIEQDSLKAARYYEDCHDVLPDDYNHAGAIYFQLERYHSAKRCFDKADYLTAYSLGCLGMMYMYGWCNLERDYQRAEKYLSDADENTAMFYAAAGDLILYNAVGRKRANLKNVINEAHDKYVMARNLEPNNESYAIRASITGEWLKAYKNTKRAGYWDLSGVYWTEYSYAKGKGRFEGRAYKTERGGESPVGWGCFIHENHISLGYMKTSHHVYMTGKGLYIGKYEDGTYWMRFGTWSNKQQDCKGYDILTDGTMSFLDK